MLNLRDIDLNLLVVFQQLHKERRVATVAENLGLTQPAVSNALSRLRKMLGDELFLRTGRGMEPTPYAAQLAEPPRQLVVIGDPEGELATAARSIRADVVATVTEDRAAGLAEAGFSLFEAKTSLGGAATAYDCRAFVCRLPVTDPAALTP